MIFYQDLSYHSDLRLLYIQQRQLIKSLHYICYDMPELHETAVRHVLIRDPRPLLKKLVRRALNLFIRPRRIEHAHEQIAVYQRHQPALYEFHRDLEAGIRFESGHVYRNDRYLLHVEILQSLSQKRNVVAGSAASARLAHEDADLVEIHFARLQI